MKAVLQDIVIAESDDIVTQGGYAYFPSASVQLECLERAGADGLRPCLPQASNSTTCDRRRAIPVPRALRSAAPVMSHAATASASERSRSGMSRGEA